VQKTLGHKFAVMTLDRYGHLWPDELEDLAERLDPGAYRRDGHRSEAPE
jgi:integrase